MMTQYRVETYNKGVMMVDFVNFENQENYYIKFYNTFEQYIADEDLGVGYVEEDLIKYKDHSVVVHLDDEDKIINVNFISRKGVK
jgi:hypothetical protein